MSKIIETTDKLKQHDYGKMAPAYSDEEYSRLLADMGDNGQVDPGTCVEQGGEVKVLDGWNRYRAALKLGMPFRYELFRGDEVEQIKLVTSRYNRRHNDKKTVTQTIGNMLKAYTALTEADKMTEAEATKAVASATGASERTVGRHKRVQGKAAPELAKAVDAGEIPVRTAEKLLKEDKVIQREVAAKVMKDKSKKSNKAKASKVAKEVKGSKDDARKPIPAELKKEFAEGETYQLIHQHLGKAWKGIRQITLTSKTWVTRAVHAAIEDLIATVKANRPAYVCQQCGGMGKPIVAITKHPCERCKGKGYIVYGNGQKPQF